MVLTERSSFVQLINRISSGGGVNGNGVALMARAIASSTKSASKARQTVGIPTISLFSGAGGLDLGFLQAGFDIKACVEIDPTYCRTLTANVGGTDGYKAGTAIYCEDIRKFDVNPFKSM